MARKVCWNITSRCNENCRFCYRLMYNQENTLEQNKDVLQILIKLNVKKITWTGGESLLYPHLYELMQIAHDNNIVNNIITNGRELSSNKIDEIEKFTDFITFSVDSLDDDVNNKLGRGIEHTNHIINLMEYITRNNKNIKIKLNSIVTKQNINCVKNVSKIVKKFKLVRWKLFKFISLRGASIENNEKFAITNEEYDNLINEILKDDIKVSIMPCTQRNIENNYILVSPIGEFIHTNQGKDEIICEYRDINYNKLEEYLKKYGC